MKKKILVIAVALMAVAMLAPPLVGMVYAKPPTLVSGGQTVTDYSVIEDPRGESGNVVSTETLEVAWTGDIEGVARYTGILMVHNLPSFAINIHEKIYFDTVTVLDKSGSLTLQVSANLARGQDVFRWTIIDGTGELANLNGNGIYWIDFATMGYYYEGQVHFDPS